jgi:hypothetical protein
MTEYTPINLSVVITNLSSLPWTNNLGSEKI